MAKNDEYRDHITLQAAAEIFNVEILVVSSLGPYGTTVISPTTNIPVATIQLGHFAEGAGEHYLCVQESFHSNEEAMEYVSEVRYENSEFSSHDENSNDNLNRSEQQITEERHGSHENEDGDISTRIKRIQAQNYRTTTYEFVLFLHDNTLTMNKGSQNLPEMSIIQLPIELIDYIIKLTVCSSDFSWPNHICYVYNQIYNVNSQFRECVKKLRHRLPRVHLPLGNAGYISVAKLIRQVGSGSGLLLEVKKIISHPRCNTAWLKLYATGYRWFTILTIQSTPNNSNPR